MDSFSLRPAIEADSRIIKRIVRQARINPTRLDWRHFTVAISKGELIGCAQLKPLRHGLTELASLVVRPAYRHRGIGRLLMERLLAEARRPLYLICRSNLGELYEKFGFQTLDANEMPAYYKRLQRFANIFIEFARPDETLLVMKLG